MIITSLFPIVIFIILTFIGIMFLFISFFFCLVSSAHLVVLVTVISFILFIFRMIPAAHYALSNKRAEAAVKIAKRLLCNNTEKGDMIDIKWVVKALLLYR